MNTYTVLRQEHPYWSTVPKVELTHTGWLPECPVSAWAQAVHNGKEIFVRMEAEEAPIRSTLTDPLSQVCNDSCLEFFFAPDSADGRYLNFEFNPLGTLYLGFGGLRPTRVRQIPKQASDLFQIQPFSTQGGWGICFSIPISFVRMYFPNFSLTGASDGNFYKCGDHTPQPHYLSWAPMSTHTPDFHRRQDFGQLLFD